MDIHPFIWTLKFPKQAHPKKDFNGTHYNQTAKQTNKQKDKEKNVKAVREKTLIISKGASMSLSADF